MTFRFVSNVDGTDFAEATRDLDPAETLFIVSSKTFTTLETMTNAHTARDWSLRALGDEQGGGQALRRRLDQRRRRWRSSASTPRTCSAFWDWVGGRYSMDSAIGLSTMLAIGPEHFRAMLAGFHAMDEHFRTAPFERNLPVLMGLLAVWYTDFFGAADGRRPALRPVPQALPRLPAAADDGEQRQARHARRRAGRLPDRRRSTGASRGPTASTRSTSSSTRGPRLIPCDFIGFCQTLNPLGQHHDLLMANVFAQTEALAFGKTAEEVKAEGTPDWLVPAPHLRGQPPDEHHPRRAADARDARHAGGALRAQRLHAGRDLGHRLVRPVGRRARQGAGQPHRPRARERQPSRRSSTTARPTR